jgi:16S rRNA (uracil1498-N3)-methyltransferase
MARYDFRSPRLFVEAAIAEGAVLPLAPNQANYLVNVLRLKPGAPVLVFNGQDGEWRAQLGAARKKGAELTVGKRVREQTLAGDLHYLFSPLKHARLDYLVQKAVEMGVARLQPVMMRRTQTERVNLERMRANAIEAAEQCGVITIPNIAAPITLGAFVNSWVPERLLVFCDEEAEVKDPIVALRAARDPAAIGRTAVTLLIGPEGGFAGEERAALLELANVVRLALGPRILRADTAGVAALALVQAVLGDWR